MLKYVMLIAILMVQVALAQQRVAVLNTEDSGEPPLKNNELSVLTDKIRSIAIKVLPKGKYEVMTTQTIQSFLGSQKEVEKVCEAADGCLAKIGQNIEADYIGQARLNRFGKLYTIKMEFYDVKRGTLVGSFTDESSKNINNLLTVVEKKAPEIFKEISSAAPTPQPVAVTTAPTTIGNFKSVKIGTQVWMAENLNVEVEGSKCYKNDPANCAKYGRLYTWEAAKKACPRGWHLPTKEEWEVMTNYIGGGRTEAKYLKAKSGWNENGNGTDKFGFAALPGGYSDGDFKDVGNYGHWWSASEYSAYNAYGRYMSYIYEYADWNYLGKTGLFSVRCVQD